MCVTGSNHWATPFTRPPRARVYGVVGIRDGHLPHLDGNLRYTRKRKRCDNADLEGEFPCGDENGPGSSSNSGGRQCAIAHLTAVTTYTVPLGPATHRSIFPSSGQNNKRIGHAALPEIVVDFLRQRHHKSCAEYDKIAGSGATAVGFREELEEKWIHPTGMPGGKEAVYKTH